MEQRACDATMMLLKVVAGLALASISLTLNAGSLPNSAAGTEQMLRDGWSIQSTRLALEPGEVISTAQYQPRNWYSASCPTTVLAALVALRVYPDPYPGMNLRSLPGMQYPIGEFYSRIQMPPESPFASAWWYRTEFSLSPEYRGKTVWLAFDGINFRANVWLNGKRIADAGRVAGTYRIYEFDVSGAALFGQPNVLAVEVFPPQPHDLQLHWVDNNPTPPDKNMGIWRPVRIRVTGPVAIRNANVISRLDLPSLDTAHLTVTADLKNATEHAVAGVLEGEIEGTKFEKAVTVEGGATKRVVFSPAEFRQLNLAHPRVWWPARMGEQNLYRAKLDFSIGPQVSDTQRVQFGIRDVKSELTSDGNLLYSVNGRRVLIRGAGWWSDMLLRSSAERREWELRYALDMNLNALRMDGKFEDAEFLDLCDRYGLLLLPGWCCCDHWERWKDWDAEDYSISAASLGDRIREFRTHPSVLTWLHGDDNSPPPPVEKAYTAILRENDWPNPFQTSQNESGSLGRTGYKSIMHPYAWVPPSYWSIDRKKGGASGFLMETSPTAAIPPVESLRLMLAPGHLWPIDETWELHSGAGDLKDTSLRIFTDALNARLGQARSLEDYAFKAQLMAYEAQRAMFEAFGQKKYLATGVAHEMLNSAWPSLIWNLYDYYLRPAGAYFGAKKACEPLHVQYAYDDNSIFVVNSLYKEFPDLKVTVRVYDVDLHERFAKDVVITAPPDSSTKVLPLPEIAGLSTAYFILLRLENSQRELVSSNLYWLSTKPDVIDWDRTEWYVTAVKSYADFSALGKLPPVSLKLKSTSEPGSNDEEVMRIQVENPSNHLAFFLRLRVSKGAGGDEVLPVVWQDNYFSLMPGEVRKVTATYRHRDLGEASPLVEVEGWNVARSSGQ